MTENELFEQWIDNSSKELKYPNSEPAILARHNAMCGWKARAELADKEKAEQSAEIAHYKAQINELRKALKDITTADEMGVCDSGYTAIYIARKALAKTPAQCLQEHDNEVIEMCAKVCDEYVVSNIPSNKIRALKGKQND